jgi:hypothetical protein
MLLPHLDKRNEKSQEKKRIEEPIEENSHRSHPSEYKYKR